VSRAARGIADSDGKKRGLGVRVGRCFVKNRFQCLVEQDVDKVGWGVVGTGLLTVVSCCDVECVAAGLGVVVGDELEE
jgi:hypothetical protein